MCKFLLYSLISLLPAPGNILLAQSYDSTQIPTNKIRISTGTFTYKGRFKEITDSTITIYNARLNTNYLVDFESINAIKIKKPFPAVVGINLLAGLVVGTLGALAFLWYDYKSDNPMYPPFGRTVLWGMMVGASGGLLFGIGEGMIGIRIAINRNKYISDKDKVRIESYTASRF